MTRQRRSGAGQIVILPGLDGTGRLLEGFRAQLERRGLAATVITYPPDRPLGYRELEALARPQLPASRPFILLGESFSGPLAIRLAAAPPPNLVGLVLSTTFARSPVPVPKSLAGLVRFAPGRPPMPLLSWWLLGRWTTPSLRAVLRDALCQVAPATLRARAIAALRVDATPSLRDMALPVLNLIGGRDRLLTRSAGRQLTEQRIDCRTRVIEGPHLLLQTATAACAQAVADFALGLVAPDAHPAAPAAD